MENFFIELCYLLLEFFIFSMVGWCIEVFLKYLQYGRFINRGFLIGPYLPIYGTGVVFITVMVRAFSGVDSSVGTTFVISFIGCGALEYFVSYILEKRFHARWWDYSTKPMNLQGRIWIGNLVLFGIGGTIIVEVINPILYPLFYKIPTKALYIIVGVLTADIIVDYIISHFVMKFVKSTVESSEADNTEAISKEIRLLAKDKSLLHQRMAEAYPDVIYRTDRINARLAEIKTEMERLQAEYVDSFEKFKKEANASLELIKINPVELSGEIINKQEDLIKSLEEGSANNELLESLRLEIDEKKKLLDSRMNLGKRNVN